MTRIKTVFSKLDPVPELWAKQSQASAAYVYYSSGSRFSYAPKGTPKDRVTAVYFEGRDLFSYGSHYLLGRLMEFNGRKIAVINRTKYSNTTSMHSSAAFNAATDAKHLVVEVSAHDGPDFRSTTTDAELSAAILENIQRESDSLYNDLENLSYGKSDSWYVKRARSDISEFNKRALALGLKEFLISVPESYFEYCRELARHYETAKRDHAQRRQSVFNFSAKSPKDLIKAPDYQSHREKMRTA